MNKQNFLFGLLLSLFFFACEKEDNAPNCNLSLASEDRLFEFLHISSGDTFLAWTSDSLVIAQVEAQLALPQADRGQHINGVILRLPEGCEVNQQWSWYFAPDSWSLSEISIELCDGNPQYVEENISEYVDNVGLYCPWSSIVLRELSNQIRWSPIYFK